MKERNNKVLRKLDKYVGIPLVYTLGLLRKKRKLNPLLQGKIQPRLALVKTAGIGDTLLVSGIIRELRDFFPDAHITMICARGNALIADMILELDEKYIFDMNKPLKSLRQLRKISKCDLLLDFGPWPKINSLISFTLRADYKIGFEKEGMHRHYVYDQAVKHSDHIHELDNYRNLLRAALIPPGGLLPSLDIGDDLTAKVSTAGLFDDDRRTVLIHPFSAGSRAYLKEWPDDNWISLARELIMSGCRVLISGGKKDAERAEQLEDKINRHNGGCLSIAGKYSLREMAAIIGRSDLLISIDTGIMHLAAALDADIVALFGPTSPSRWGPQSSKAIVLNQKVCTPCLSLGFENICDKPRGCISSIKVEDVLRAAERFIPAKQEQPALLSPGDVVGGEEVQILQKM
jgi:heptosyltransferase I